jgi:hypothetical protein
MLSLSDPTWKKLRGGFQVLYDVSDVLLRLEKGEDVWDELWRELYHQGNIGEASYAAVPHLFRIVARLPQRGANFYSLISTIEVARHRKSNPPLPDWLSESYIKAWNDLLELAVDDLRKVNSPLTVRSILGAIALAKGDLKLGALISTSDDSEISEILEQYEAWSNLYR